MGKQCLIIRAETKQLPAKFLPLLPPFVRAAQFSPCTKPKRFCFILWAGRQSRAA